MIEALECIVSMLALAVFAFFVLGWLFIFFAEFFGDNDD